MVKYIEQSHEILTPLSGIKGPKTTWICNSIEHTCANVDLDEAGRGEWNHDKPFNDCVVVLPMAKGDEYGAGMLKPCLYFNELVLFRILKVEKVEP